MYRIIVICLLFLFIVSNTFAQSPVQNFSIKSINHKDKVNHFDNDFFSNLYNLKIVLDKGLDNFKNIYKFKWSGHYFEVKSNIDDFILNGKSKRNRFIITISVTFNP